MNSANSSVAVQCTRSAFEDDMCDELMVLNFFYCRVTEQSAVNQMTAHNLAIVFGPTLMWSVKAIPNEHSLSSTVILQGKLVEYFITDRKQLFATA